MEGLQVVAEQVAQPEALLALQILFALQQQPARPCGAIRPRGSGQKPTAS